MVQTIRPEYEQELQKISKGKFRRFPSLKTLLMVETALKKADNLLTREELKRKLPEKITHPMLNLILQHLEDGGKILDGRKGILWIYNESKKLDKMIKRGTEV